MECMNTLLKLYAVYMQPWIQTTLHLHVHISEKHKSKINKLCLYSIICFCEKKEKIPCLFFKSDFSTKGETTYVPNPFNPPLGGTGSSKKGSSSTSLPPSKSTSAFGFLRWSFRLDWRFRWFLASTNSFLSFVCEYKITRYIYNKVSHDQCTDSQHNMEAKLMYIISYLWFFLHDLKSYSI